jgi:hypothetical protein
MVSSVLEKKTNAANYLARGKEMARTLVALAVLLLVIGLVMWQRRRPPCVPKVAILPAPEPPKELRDTEIDELVDAGIPEEFIDQYVAAKERSWWDRNKYKAAGTALVGGGLTYMHWRNETEKLNRKVKSDLEKRERIRQQQQKNPQCFNYLRHGK